MLVSICMARWSSHSSKVQAPNPDIPKVKRRSGPSVPWVTIQAAMATTSGMKTRNEGFRSSQSCMCNTRMAARLQVLYLRQAACAMPARL